MSKRFYAVSHDSIQLEAWLKIDVDVRHPSFFGNCEVYPRGVDSDRANPVGVLAN